MTHPDDLPPKLRWVLVVGLPVVAAVLAHVGYTPAFQTNDDVCMNMMAAGVVFNSRPSEFLLYISPVVGYPISRLYMVAPEVPWYYAAHLATHLLAGMVCAHAALVARPTRARAVLLAGFFLTVDLALFVLPQFTLTASLAATAAVALWLSRSPARPWTAATLALYLGLWVLAAGWRNHCCLMVLVMAAPLAVLKAARDWVEAPGRGWERLRVPLVSAVLPALAGACAASTTVGFTKAYYAAHPGWGTFDEYNTVRSRLVFSGLWASPDEVGAAYRAAGWRAEDAELVNSWCLIDRELFTPDRMAAAAARLPAPVMSVAKELPKFWPTTKSDPLFRLLGAWALVLGAFLPGCRWAWGYYAAALGGAAAGWLYIVLHAYAPTYVFEAGMIFALWVGLIVADWGGGGDGSGFRRVVVVTAVLLAAAVAPTHKHLRARSKTVAAGHHILTDGMRALDPKPDQLFLLWGASFPYEWVPPWENLERFRDFKGYPLAGATNTPHTNGRLAEFGIANPAPALFERPDGVRLIASPECLPLLSRFFVRHYGVVVTLEPDAGPPIITIGGVERTRAYRWRYVGKADDYMHEEWVRNAR